MTTSTLQSIPLRRKAPRAERYRPALQLARVYARTAAHALRTHIQDNLYTLSAAGCFSAAGFVHSTFTGLLVTGACLLTIELKNNGE